MDENLEIINQQIQDILDDKDISDSSLMQYCLDAIELASPNKYSEKDKHTIIWINFQSRNTDD